MGSLADMVPPTSLLEQGICSGGAKSHVLLWRLHTVCSISTCIGLRWSCSDQLVVVAVLTAVAVVVMVMVAHASCLLNSPVALPTMHHDRVGVVTQRKTL
jgi:hypothetical protein